MKKHLVQIILVLVMASGFGCEKPVWTLGIIALKVPSGETIYFRRQAAGLNFDRLSITKEGDVCKPADERKDIIFRELGPEVYYRIVNDELHIFSYDSPKVPTDFLSSTKLVFHELSNSQDIEQIEKAKGLVRVDVPLADTLCS